MGEFDAFLVLLIGQYKTILSVIGVMCGIAGYYFYFRNIFFREGNKPCIFTWIPVAIIVCFGVYIQWKGGASLIEVSPTILTATFCVTLSILSLFNEIRRSEWVDWVCFIVALIAIVWWRISDSLVMPAIIVSAADVISFYPTLKRGWKNPFKETTLMWSLSFLKFVFAILALKTLSVATLFFPATIMIVNGSFVVVILARRKHLSRENGLTKISCSS
jgi:hypothetical protein